MARASDLTVAVLVIGMLLTGCEEATQVLVTFVVDPGSVSRAERIRIRIWSQEQEIRLDRTVNLGSGPREVSFPTSVPVSPIGGDTSRIFRIEGELLENEGEVFAEQRAVVGFVEHQRLEVRLRFDDRCLDRFECSADQTCREGFCVDAYIPRPGESVEPWVPPAVCPSDPCRATAPQCGCDLGLACRPGTAADACYRPGPAGLGERCTDPAECNGGLSCSRVFSGSLGQCVAYCEQNADCPGGFCFGGPPGTVGVCFSMCNPLSVDSCPEGLACVIVSGSNIDDGAQRGGSTCDVPGDAPVGDSCGFARCVQGAYCSSEVCRQLCAFGEEPGCAAGTRCTPVTPAIAIGGVSYGVCE